MIIELTKEQENKIEFLYNLLKTETNKKEDIINFCINYTIRNILKHK